MFRYTLLPNIIEIHQAVPKKSKSYFVTLTLGVDGNLFNEETRKQNVHREETINNMSEQAT